MTIESQLLERYQEKESGSYYDRIQKVIPQRTNEKINERTQRPIKPGKVWRYATDEEIQAINRTKKTITETKIFTKQRH